MRHCSLRALLLSLLLLGLPACTPDATPEPGADAAAEAPPLPAATGSNNPDSIEAATPARRLDAVAGLPLALPPDSVQARMAQRDGVQPSSAPPDTPAGANDLFFQGGTFAGLPVESWLFSFQEGRLHAGRIRLAPSGEAAFRTVARHLAEQYGDGTDTPPLPATTGSEGEPTPAETMRSWSFRNGFIRLRLPAATDAVEVHFSAEAGSS